MHNIPFLGTFSSTVSGFLVNPDEERMRVVRQCVLESRCVFERMKGDNAVVIYRVSRIPSAVSDGITTLRKFCTYDQPS